MATKQNLVISTDATLLDVGFIHAKISAKYWAKNRSIEDIKSCIEHSLNFGLYLNGRQIGYARVVTDYTVFAYLLDVFIDEDLRGKGFGAFLIEHILSDKKVEKVTVWRLATEDAHGLYKKFGFTPLKNPEKMMEKKIQKLHF